MRLRCTRRPAAAALVAARLRRLQSRCSLEGIYFETGSVINGARFICIVRILPGQRRIGMEQVDVTKTVEPDGTTTIETVHRQVSSDYLSIRRVIFYLLDIILLILAVRFVLRALGADPTSSFTGFMYSISWPFVAPFQGVAAAVRVQGGVFEWSSLIAMAVYCLIGYIVVRLFRIIAANNK